ncbi:MAG: 50S ribosomal protein L25 [Gemmataceae bacterium]|nr:50S ribosomal protein L25 [Gemmataceae bacterium]
MSEIPVLETQKREGRGGRKAFHLRKTGVVPGVLYGHKEETLSISATAEALAAIVKAGARVVEVKSAAGQEKAQVIALQFDHLGKELLHFDLKRVSADERIKVPVRIEIKGIAPGVTGGGILDQPLHVLHVECPAVSVPDTIRVSINELQLGAAIHVKELALPEGVTALDDPDAVVVHVTLPAQEAAPAEAVAESAEPEVIRKAKAEGEDEDKK